MDALAPHLDAALSSFCPSELGIAQYQLAHSAATVSVTSKEHGATISRLRDISTARAVACGKLAVIQSKTDACERLARRAIHIASMRQSFGPTSSVSLVLAKASSYEALAGIEAHAPASWSSSVTELQHALVLAPCLDVDVYIAYSRTLLRFARSLVALSDAKTQEVIRNSLGQASALLFALLGRYGLDVGLPLPLYGEGEPFADIFARTHKAAGTAPLPEAAVQSALLLAHVPSGDRHRVLTFILLVLLGHSCWALSSQGGSLQGVRQEALRLVRHLGSPQAVAALPKALPKPATLPADTESLWRLVFASLSSSVRLAPDSVSAGEVALSLHDATVEYTTAVGTCDRRQGRGAAEGEAAPGPAEVAGAGPDAATLEHLLLKLGGHLPHPPPAPTDAWASGGDGGPCEEDVEGEAGDVDMSATTGSSASDPMVLDTSSSSSSSTFLCLPASAPSGGQGGRGRGLATLAVAPLQCTGRSTGTLEGSFMDDSDPGVLEMSGSSSTSGVWPGDEPNSVGRPQHIVTQARGGSAVAASSPGQVPRGGAGGGGASVHTPTTSGPHHGVRAPPPLLHVPSSCRPAAHVADGMRVNTAYMGRGEERDAGQRLSLSTPAASAGRAVDSPAPFGGVRRGGAPGSLLHLGTAATQSSPVPQSSPHHEHTRSTDSTYTSTATPVRTSGGIPLSALALDKRGGHAGASSTTAAATQASQSLYTPVNCASSPLPLSGMSDGSVPFGTRHGLSAPRGVFGRRGGDGDAVSCLAPFQPYCAEGDGRSVACADVAMEDSAGVGGTPVDNHSAGRAEDTRPTASDMDAPPSPWTQVVLSPIRPAGLGGRAAAGSHGPSAVMIDETLNSLVTPPQTSKQPPLPRHWGARPRTQPQTEGDTSGVPSRPCTDVLVEEVRRTATPLSLSLARANAARLRATAACLGLVEEGGVLRTLHLACAACGDQNDRHCACARRRHTSSVDEWSFPTPSSSPAALSPSSALMAQEGGRVRASSSSSSTTSSRKRPRGLSGGGSARCAALSSSAQRADVHHEGDPQGIVELDAPTPAAGPSPDVLLNGGSAVRRRLLHASSCTSASTHGHDGTTRGAVTPVAHAMDEEAGAEAEEGVGAMAGASAQAMPPSQSTPQQHVPIPVHRPSHAHSPGRPGSASAAPGHMPVTVAMADVPGSPGRPTAFRRSLTSPGSATRDARGQARGLDSSAPSATSCTGAEDARTEHVSRHPATLAQALVAAAGVASPFVGSAPPPPPPTRLHWHMHEEECGQGEEEHDGSDVRVRFPTTPARPRRTLRGGASDGGGPGADVVMDGGAGEGGTLQGVEAQALHAGCPPPQVSSPSLGAYRAVLSATGAMRLGQQSPHEAGGSPASPSAGPAGGQPLFLSRGALASHAASPASGSSLSLGLSRVSGGPSCGPGGGRVSTPALGWGGGSASSSITSRLGSLGRVHWSAEVLAAEYDRRAARQASIDDGMMALASDRSTLFAPPTVPSSAAPTEGIDRGQPDSAEAPSLPRLHIPREREGMAPRPSVTSPSSAQPCPSPIPPAAVPGDAAYAKRLPGAWPVTVPSHRCWPLAPPKYSPLSPAFAHWLCCIAAPTGEGEGYGALPAPPPSSVACLSDDEYDMLTVAIKRAYIGALAELTLQERLGAGRVTRPAPSPVKGLPGQRTLWPVRRNTESDDHDSSMLY